MATKKPSVPTDEKLEDQDLNIFDVLAALDRKDYGYYDRLSEAQQKKFVPYLIIQWMSAVQASSEVQGYYVMSTEYNANKYLFNENIQKHSKLQWLMLCAASPGIGKQFHKWIPNIKEKVSLLREPAKIAEIKEYYKKIYPKADTSDIAAVSEAYVHDQKRKLKLASLFPNMKLEDIEALNQVITDEDIKQYEKDLGN